MTGLLSVVLALAGLAAEFPEPINNQKGEHTLTSPIDAQKKFTLPQGFNVSLFAHEPDVRQPIALTTDSRGRLWVAECYSYDDRSINYSADQRDRIVIYEDTNHDGRYDKRTVFWDKGWKLTSVEVGFGGVWALCAPNLLFIPDKDGDDVPDSEPQVMLDGWDDDRIRHNIVNGLKWGPDGWLYGRHGIMATSYVGKPGTPKARRTAVNCGIWRYHPSRQVFEMVCNGGTNSWGHDWNEYGELIWINTVIGHLWHGFPGGYFRRMYGEHLQPNLYEYIDQHADHFHWDTKLAWNKARDASGLTDTAGGGHAHCGMMVYLGDNWPKQYQGELFTVNLLGHRINQDHLARKGTGYVGKHRPDFALANDEWFRGIDLVYGNDGGVFIADWSDVGECHENDGIHRTSGRIYKVTHGRVKAPTIGDVAKLSNERLVELQGHANEWYPRQARKVLQERTVAGQDMTAVHAGLMQQFLRQKNQVHKLRAMWGLQVTGGATGPWLREQLNHPSEHVRVWAVRLLTQERAVKDRTRRALEQMAGAESSAIVRLYLAASLQVLPVTDRVRLAEALLKRTEDAGDHNQELLIWYGIESIASQNPELALKLIRDSRLQKPRIYAARRIVEQITEKPAVVNSLVKLAANGTRGLQRAVLEGMSAGLNGWRQAPKPKDWEWASRKLRALEDESIGKWVQELDVVFGSGRALDELRKIALDGSADAVSRRAALQVLIENKPDDLAKVLLQLVNVRETEGVAVRGLAVVDDPQVAKKIVDRYARMKPADRLAAIGTLASRASYAAYLLKAVENGRIARGEIRAFHARQIRSLGDPKLEESLREHWGEVRTSSAEKKKLMAKHRQRLTPAVLQKADLVEGRQLFNLVCASCHTLFGEGKDIGPDITGANRNNLEYLLENIADPSAMIGGDFRMSVINLKNGQVINGAVLRDTGRTLEIQTATEKVTIDSGDVKTRKQSALSLMPDGLMEAMTDEQIRDLFAYLMSPKQVALPN
jgi:putative membrane-bound dehydrogenase-like protein